MPPAGAREGGGRQPAPSAPGASAHPTHPCPHTHIRPHPPGSACLCMRRTRHSPAGVRGGWRAGGGRAGASRDMADAFPVGCKGLYDQQGWWCTGQEGMCGMRGPPIGEGGNREPTRCNGGEREGAWPRQCPLNTQRSARRAQNTQARALRLASHVHRHSDGLVADSLQERALVIGVDVGEAHQLDGRAPRVEEAALLRWRVGVGRGGPQPAAGDGGLEGGAGPAANAAIAL